MKHEARAVLKRPLKGRSRECVVDDRHGADGLRNRADLSNVDHPQIWIGGRLEIDDLCLARQNSLERRWVAKVGDAHADPESREPPGEEGEGVPVQDMIDDDFVAGAYQGP
jgi:hypothetical protein